MKRIVFTGGGSAGHVIPNVAIIERLRTEYDIFYVGTDGIEKTIIRPLNIPYAQISCPKFVRGFSIENLSIPKRLFNAVHSAKDWLMKIKPDLVFSKGGYVSLPVVWAAHKLKIPVISHESDLTLGLANKLIRPFCRYFLTAFPETAKPYKNGKYCGAPIRDSVFKTDGADYSFHNGKPTLLVLGGGSGSKHVNEVLRKNIFTLSSKYNILHLCGKGNSVQSSIKSYRQMEFVTDMGAAYHACDFVIARAGANTVFECLALKKPTLFIPLQNKRSRGDQLKNAKYFLNKGLCHLLKEEDISRLPQAVDELVADEQLKVNLKNCTLSGGLDEIISVIKSMV